MTTTRRLIGIIAIVIVVLLSFGGGWLAGRTGMGLTPVDPGSLTELERRFVEQMRGAVLVGSFTVTGRENRAPSPDRYEVASVEKIGDDEWRFNARSSTRAWTSRSPSSCRCGG
jgi:hypothetical protein